MPFYHKIFDIPFDLYFFVTALIYLISIDVVYWLNKLFVYKLFG